MAKSKIKKLLTDYKHWAGWILTTVAITLIFHPLGVHLHRPLYYMLILLAIVVVVDVAKHKLELQ